MKSEDPYMTHSVSITPAPAAALLVVAALLMASTMSLNAQAEPVYRWVDDEGITHFTAHPPKNRPSDALRPQTGHSEPVDYSLQAPTSEGETTPSSPTETSGVHNAERAEQQRRACEQAQDNLAVLERGGRIAVPGDDGEPQFLTSEQMAERAATLRQQLADGC